MENTPFKARERALLLGLMTLGGSASNPELRAHIGDALDGEPRRRANGLGLVTSQMAGRSFHHKLTEDGWTWCVVELAGPAPENSGPLGRTLYGVLGIIKGYLDATDMSLTDFVDKAAGSDIAITEDLDQAIRDAYWKLAREPQDWVLLTRLRAQLGDAPREKVDEALRRMEQLQDVHLVPEADQKSLTDQDRKAAVVVGGVSKHLLAVEAR